MTNGTSYITWLHSRKVKCVKGGVGKVLLLVLFVAKIFYIAIFSSPTTNSVLETGSASFCRWNREKREPKPRFEASSFERTHQGRFFPFCIPHGDESRHNLQNIEVFFQTEMMDIVLTFGADSVQIRSSESFEVVLLLPLCEFQIHL